MLRSAIFLFVAVCAAAWFGPDAIRALSNAQASNEATATGSHRTQPTTKRRANQVASGRQVRLKMGRNGHYRADVRVNGRKFKMMVDTGASLIALTAKDAKRMGVYPDAGDFIYETRTANGVARIALVTLKEVKIGRIRVKNVKASVHRGKGLDTNLLGMSFLNRLRKFNFEGDTLTLVN